MTLEQLVANVVYASVMRTVYNRNGYQTLFLNPTYARAIHSIYRGAQ